MDFMTAAVNPVNDYFLTHEWLGWLIMALIYAIACICYWLNKWEFFTDKKQPFGEFIQEQTKELKKKGPPSERFTAGQKNVAQIYGCPFDEPINYHKESNQFNPGEI